MTVWLGPDNESTVHSPITATLGRVSALDRYLAAVSGPPMGDGWVVGAELVAPGSARLGAELERLMARYDTRDRKVAASFLLMAYVWNSTAAPITVYLTEERVPDASAGHVAMRFGEGEGPGVAFLSGRFAALPRDPSSSHPDALILSSPDQMSLWLRRRLSLPLAALVAELHTRSRLGVRALWGIAADRCGDAFLWAGRAIGDQERTRREAELFLRAPGGPWRDAPAFYTVEHGERRTIVLERVSCCLSYKLPGGTRCNGCPLLTVEEREQRLRKIVAAEASA